MRADRCVRLESRFPLTLMQQIRIVQFAPRLAIMRFLHRLWLRAAQDRAIFQTANRRTSGCVKEELLRLSSNHEVIFHKRTTAELVRLYALLGACGVEVFARNAYPMFKFGHRLLGDRLFGAIFRPAVYNIFIAGETEADWRRTMDDMKLKGLNPLLSPMLEDDLDEGETSKERVHEHNLSVIRSCLATCSSAEMPEPRTLAIKLTAFINPKHLELISDSLEAQRRPPRPPSGENVDRGEADRGKGGGGGNRFIKGAETLLLEALTTATSGEEGERSAAETAANFRRGLQHLINIAEEARERGAMLLVDAEHAHLQPAVRAIALQVMAKVNHRGRATVVNTYQCYLKDSFRHLTEDLSTASSLGFPLGVKLVRGAYLEFETERSRRLGTDSPILPSYRHTNENYDRSALMLLNRIGQNGGDAPRPVLILATHNMDSVLKSAAAMDEMGIARNDGGVHFAQIQGMGEQLSVPLARSGYSCLKLVPCGSVSEVLPWLARRMQENSAAKHRAAQEKDVVAKEIRRRFKDAFNNTKI